MRRHGTLRRRASPGKGEGPESLRSRGVPGKSVRYQQHTLKRRLSSERELEWLYDPTLISLEAVARPLTSE